MMNTNKLFKIEATIAWILMFANVSLIIANIIMRRFADAPIFGATELVRFLALFTVCFAISQNEWIDGNVTMTLFHEIMKKKSAHILRAITDSACAIVFIFVTYLMLSQSYGRFMRHDITQELKFPTWIPALFIGLGFLSLTVCLFVKAILRWRVVKTGEEINFRGLVISQEDEAIES